MIQANEARVNNIYTRELQSQRGLEYDKYFVLDEKAMGQLFSDDNSLALQDLFGIPLTEEILNSAGFHKGIELQDFKGVYNYYECGNVTGVFYKKDAEYYYNWDMKLGAIKFLHQLQNLYHSLTETELIFSPINSKLKLKNMNSNCPTDTNLVDPYNVALNGKVYFGVTMKKASPLAHDSSYVQDYETHVKSMPSKDIEPGKEFPFCGQNYCTVEEGIDYTIVDDIVKPLK